MTKILHFLRWIAVLPASFVSLFLIHILTVLVYRFFNYGMMSEFTIELIASLCSSAAFVGTGVITAPAYRKTVSIILCTIFVFILVLSMLLSFGLFEGWELWRIIAVIVVSTAGSIYTAVFFNKELEDNPE